MIRYHTSSPRTIKVPHSLRQHLLCLNPSCLCLCLCLCLWIQATCCSTESPTSRTRLPLRRRQTVARSSGGSWHLVRVRVRVRVSNKWPNGAEAAGTWLGLGLGLGLVTSGPIERRQLAPARRPLVRIASRRQRRHGLGVGVHRLSPQLRTVPADAAHVRGLACACYQAGMCTPCAWHLHSKFVARQCLRDITCRCRTPRWILAILTVSMLAMAQRPPAGAGAPEP